MRKQRLALIQLSVRFALALVVSVILAGRTTLAQISYSVMDSTVTQDFNSLPTDLPQNNSIQTAYTQGWKDNSTTVAGATIGLPGWYLYHPTDPANTDEDGFNHHQRVRSGPGSSGTGAFYLFGASSSDAEKALGAVGSNTIAPNGQNLYMAMRLVNNTGQSLTGFNITYDGEQWRSAGGATAESVTFAYSLSASETNWFESDTVFENVATAGYTGAVYGGAQAVDGNTTGLFPNITSPVSGINWAPGQELWLRWTDQQIPATDDGMAIDNVRFSAGNSIVNPNDIFSVTSGPSSSPSTWSNNQTPSGEKTYRVVSGHTVTVDAPFQGIELRANAGGTVNFGNAGNAAHVPLIVIDDGGSLTETAAGDFALGDVNQPALGILALNNSAPVAFAIDAGGNFRLDMTVTGSGDLNFNSGAGSTLWLADADGHGGTIRFNGSGDRVRITKSSLGVGTLEMNSTGANTVYYDPDVQSDRGTIIFNQPGVIDHAATVTSPTRRRLHGVHDLVVNAPITLDLSKGFPDNSGLTDERRFLIRESVTGSADITVNGMSFDPTDPFSQFITTLNEFELGSSGDVNPPASSYSGTLTANNYVNVEVRHNLPNARIVVNDNALLDAGLQTVPGVEGSAATLKDIQVGEIVVNDGGILEVGFEQDEPGSPFFQQTGHHAGHLVLTNNAARGGDLTLSNGATLRMQINGTANDLFDRITVQGDLVLDGTLEVLISPPSTSDTANAVYVPNVGDVFNIITTAAGSSPATDFNDDSTVDGGDLTVWRGAFGPANATGDADGDGDSDGADFLAWQSTLGMSGSMGTISGDFDAVSIIDPNGFMAGNVFNVVKTATGVQLVVASPAAAIPEPSTAVMMALGAWAFRARCRARR